MFSNLGLDSKLEEWCIHLEAKGLQPDEIAAKIGGELSAGAAEAGAFLLKALKDRLPEMLDDRRKIQSGFLRRQQDKWRQPFELLKMLLEAAREAGAEFAKQNHAAAVADQDLVFDALVLLHARACLVSSEVLWLMEGGFASGALARWRTLHEITVVSFFIKEKGREIAERYLLHDVVDSFKAAKQYQEHCKALGRKPLSEEEAAQLKAAHDELCDRFGTDYKDDWGWAAPVFRLRRPVKFADIEEAVELSHLRPYFKLACYSNHAGCKGLRFDLGTALVPPDQRLLLAGPSDAGLFDPGVCMAISLQQVTSTLLLHGQVTLMALVVVEALGKLRDEVEDAFARAEADLAEKAQKTRKR